MTLTTTPLSRGAAARTLRLFDLEEADVKAAFERADAHFAEWTSVAGSPLHLMFWGGGRNYKLKIEDTPE
jgi:hypothetical protein